MLGGNTPQSIMICLTSFPRSRPRSYDVAESAKGSGKSSARTTVTSYATCFFYAVGVMSYIERASTQMGERFSCLISYSLIKRTIYKFLYKLKCSATL